MLPEGLLDKLAMLRPPGTYAGRDALAARHDLECRSILSAVQGASTTTSAVNAPALPPSTLEAQRAAELARLGAILADLNGQISGDNSSSTISEADALPGLQRLRAILQDTRMLPTLEDRAPATQDGRSTEVSASASRKSTLHPGDYTDAAFWKQVAGSTSDRPDQFVRVGSSSNGLQQLVASARPRVQVHLWTLLDDDAFVDTVHAFPSARERSEAVQRVKLELIRSWQYTDRSSLLPTLSGIEDLCLVEMRCGALILHALMPRACRY